MKLTVTSKPFAAALAIAGRVIETKTPWPIMSNIHMRAEGSIGGSLTIRGTNAEITYQATVTATVETEGEVLIDFATLSKFVSAARGDEISIDVGAESAVVKCGRGRIALAVADVGDFPFYTRTEGEMVAIDPATFVRALRFCAAAVKPSDVKYHIAGVNIAEGGAGCDFCGTDGQIAHMATLPHLPAIGGGGQLPIEAVGIIASIIDKTDEAKIIVTGTGWAVDAGDVMAWGKVIDAKYPDLERALSRFEWREIAIADPADITQAVDIAICGTDAGSDKARHVVLRCDDGIVLRGLRMSGGVVTAGRAEADGEVRARDALAINADYLRTTLNGLGVDGVTISSASEAIRIAPRQVDSAIAAEGVIFKFRVSEAELADV